ncbi:MAG: hypothetical protein V9G19_04385 [Tetrasphaera sp.]
MRRELLYLRKGAGYADKRLSGCVALVGVLGGETEPTEVLRERLESAIDSLHDADGELLRIVFGLDDDVRGVATLSARRDHAGARLGLGREAVADRDARAVERLLHQLVTGWYPKSPVAIRIPESHNGIVNHVVHIGTVVDNMRHELTHHQYRFMVTFDGAEFVAVAATHGGAVAVTRGEWALRTLTTPGGVVHQFWHVSPLRRGVTYELGFIVRNPDMASDPYWLSEESLAFHEPTRHVVFEVQFKGTVPEQIWTFSGLTAAERPGRPSQGVPLTPESGTVRAQFRDLYGGLYAGVAWDGQLRASPATMPTYEAGLCGITPVGRA